MKPCKQGRLMLSRKIGTSITIGHSIKLTIKHIWPDLVAIVSRINGEEFFSQRAVGEDFMLTKGVQIRFTETRGTHVSLSITCPRDLHIVRTELLNHKLKD